MADICVASIAAVMAVSKIKVEGTPTIDRIVAQCQGLEPFAAAHPSLQPGAPSPA